jgi:hypothetical protein
VTDKVYIVVEWVDRGYYILGVYVDKEHAQSIVNKLTETYNKKYARFKHFAESPYAYVVEKVITTKGTIQ